MSQDATMLILPDKTPIAVLHPNENFAREIMELFALGVGNYTEKDIQEAARAFTGWHVREGRFWKNRLQHDESAKTVLSQSGLFDGNDIVDLCLAQKACPQFLAMKLAKTFVCSEPSNENIEHLASRIRHHDFHLKPVLYELFTSQWFFDAGNRRAVIKSPLDLVLGALRTLTDPIRWPGVVSLLTDLGQNVFEPPSVKGWEGGRLWITSQSLLQRANFATELTTSEKYGPLSTDVRRLATESNEAVVEKLERWLLSDSNRRKRDASANCLRACQERAEGSADQKLHGLIQLILTLPEFQLV